VLIASQPLVDLAVNPGLFFWTNDGLSNKFLSLLGVYLGGLSAELLQLLESVSCYFADIMCLVATLLYSVIQLFGRFVLMLVVQVHVCVILLVFL
jgi:hypothetical protein